MQTSTTTIHRAEIEFAHAEAPIVEVSGERFIITKVRFKHETDTADTDGPYVELEARGHRLTKKGKADQRHGEGYVSVGSASSIQRGSTKANIEFAFFAKHVEEHELDAYHQEVVADLRALFAGSQELSRTAQSIKAHYERLAAEQKAPFEVVGSLVVEV